MVESTLYTCTSNRRVECEWTAFEREVSREASEFLVCPNCTGELKETDIEHSKVPDDLNKNDIARLARNNELDEYDFVVSEFERRIEELKLEMPAEQAEKLAESLSGI